MKKEKEPIFDLDEEEQELSDSFDRAGEGLIMCNNRCVSYLIGKTTL